MTTRLPTACGKTVLVDDDTAEVLGGRSLSLGSHGYVQIWDGEVTLLHRWIMGVKRGAGYRVIVDHISGDVLDNRRENLRCVSPSQSNYNRRVRGRCVYPQRSGTWYAKVHHEGEAYHLGTFATPMEADKAVVDFREKMGIVHDRFTEAA